MKKKVIAAGAKTMMELMPYELEAMKEVVSEKLRLFGAVNKA